MSKYRNSRAEKAFTLIETLVFLAIFTIVAGAVSAFLLWTIRANTKARALRETLDNLRRATAVLTAEIRRARALYTPTSTSSQISLETTASQQPGETVGYVDIYTCGTRLCLKREGEAPLALTSESVAVTNFLLTPIGTSSPSVRLVLTLRSANVPSQSVEGATLTATTTAAARGN